ncbi:hypothetical protein H0H93_002901 [Arthromyces matolae]|nr:hypothetical protein H0H93_002901 [Arthromyces matolae]
MCTDDDRSISASDSIATLKRKFRRFMDSHRKGEDTSILRRSIAYLPLPVYGAHGFNKAVDTRLPMLRLLGGYLGVVGNGPGLLRQD